MHRVEDMPRREQVVLYVMGVIQGLKEKGLIEGGKVDITPRGLAAYDQLKASGFKPTDDEVRIAMRTLNGL